MESSDITILFLTANHVPAGWADYQKRVLLAAAGSSEVITLSRSPLNWGRNVLDREPETISNIYYQMLVGAKLAATEYVGIAEDDVLYPAEHFNYRPPLDAFGYNINRFGVFTWGRPTYFWKDRFSNSTLIASRALLIDALEERFLKWPHGTPTGVTGELGRPNIEHKLGVGPRKSVEFSTEISVVRVDHGLGVDTLARSHRKAMGILRAYDIPHWGKAKDIVAKFV